MPKKHSDFPNQLSLNVTADLLLKLKALGYLWEGKGEYGGPARQLLIEGVERAIEAMPEKKRKDFDEILANVKLHDAQKKEITRAD